MASPSRQIGDVSFVTNSNNNSYPKLFYILKAGEIWKHWHCHLLCIVFACALCCGVCCTLVITALRSTATTPGQVRGGPGAARPKSWFHLTQHFRLWVNYISLSAQVGILCDFSTKGKDSSITKWMKKAWLHSHFTSYHGYHEWSVPMIYVFGRYGRQMPWNPKGKLWNLHLSQHVLPISTSIVPFFHPIWQLSKVCEHHFFQLLYKIRDAARVVCHRVAAEPHYLICIVPGAGPLVIIP